MFCVKLQSIVVGMTVVLVQRDAAEVRERLHGLTDGVVVVVVVARQTISTCSDVRDTDHVFRADLLLHFEVPLLFAAMTIVLIHSQPAHAKRRRLRIEAGKSGLWQRQVGRCSSRVTRASERCSLCCLT